MYLAVEAVENPIVGMLQLERAEKLTDKGQLFLMAVFALEEPLLREGKEARLPSEEGGFEVRSCLISWEPKIDFVLEGC